MKNRSDPSAARCPLRSAHGRRRRVAAVAAAILSVFAGSLSAAGNTVREIAIENLGPGAIDRGFVEAHAAIAVGDLLDGGNIARDLRALLDTRRFSSVELYAEEMDGGLRLIYALRNKFRLSAPPDIQGGRHFRERKLRNWIGLEAGDYVDEQTVAARTRKTIDEYRKDYYPDAAVTWTITETDVAEGLAELRIRIHEGERSRVKKILFRGNRGVSSRHLSKVVAQRAWWNPLGWIGGRKYDETEIRMARMDLRDHYVDLGYLDAVVQEPSVERLKKGRLLVTFNVEEGAAYTFGTVGLLGFSIFPESSLREKIVCREGTPASAEAIRATVRNLEQFYGAQGYVGTRVRPSLSPRGADGVADVDFRVAEGTLTTVRHIRIRGNTRTRDKVIRREVLVYPGERYDTVKAEQSERRLMNLGFFSSVRTYDAPTPAPDERDMIIEVEEKRTGQLMLGAGFSSVDNLIGYVELGQGNFDLTGWPYFTGGGQKLRARAQFGTTRKLYELSFTEPWFMDRRLSLGVDLYHSDYDYSDYDLKRTGGALNLGMALPGPNRIVFRYQLERVDLYNVSDTNRYVFADDPSQEYYFTSESDTIESSFRVTLSHDTRNNPFFPTRGNKADLFGQASGGPLGFDTDVYQVGFRSWHYVPLLFGHVLSLRTRYEVVDEYGDTDEVPITSRLYLGGGRTLRGFDYREVGPKVIRDVPAAGGGTVVNARAYGGRSLALASLEYTIPLVARLRMAGFYDTGNAWLDAYELDLDDLASSYGVGIRLDIPGFPIRVDRAWIIERDDAYTGEDSWVVWIGYDF